MIHTSKGILRVYLTQNTLIFTNIIRLCEGEKEVKMSYNPDKSKEQPSLPPDTVMDGAIIEVEDGKVRDFVKNLSKWKDPDQKAINVNMQVVYNKKSYDFEQVFPYEQDEQGYLIHSERSNFGKFKKKYGSLPKKEIKIKAFTTDEGYLRLKLD